MLSPDLLNSIIVLIFPNEFNWYIFFFFFKEKQHLIAIYVEVGWDS